jgi:uncharacterized repeat protein (TIGR03833 family)
VADRRLKRLGGRARTQLEPPVIEEPKAAMAKKQASIRESQAQALTHQPFAKLAKERESMAGRSTPARPARPPSLPGRVRLALESAGRSGKVVTRITGLPKANLEAIASRLKRALGCGAVLEGEDLVLLGSLVERASEWLDRAGDPRAITLEATVTRQPPREASHESGASRTPTNSATERANLRRGQRVAIVLKADQGSGKLTEGIVRDLLTNSATHPHGIKVRLESGEVGRVKIIYE